MCEELPKTRRNNFKIKQIRNKVSEFQQAGKSQVYADFAQRKTWKSTGTTRFC